MTHDDAFAPTAADVDPLLRLLEETPRHLESITRGLDDDRLRCRPSADDWSANEILAHLRACADVWGGSIVTMIEQDRPSLRYVSPRTAIRDRRPRAGAPRAGRGDATARGIRGDRVRPRAGRW